MAHCSPKHRRVGWSADKTHLVRCKNVSKSIMNQGSSEGARTRPGRVRTSKRGEGTYQVNDEKVHTKSRVRPEDGGSHFSPGNRSGQHPEGRGRQRLLRRQTRVGTRLIECDSGTRGSSNPRKGTGLEREERETKRNALK